MRLPNLLATKWGRFAAFFCLYVTEGLPQGFTGTAVATQMRRQGVSITEIGIFVGTLYLPWAWKWLMGPIVDTVYSERWGKRRVWIVAMQTLMVLALLVSMGIDFTTQIKLYTAIILFVNIFGATQDVAIDALAVGVLREEERGTANGLMFGGAYLGNALGGSGVLFLSDVIGFQSSAMLVIAAVLMVTVFVALPLREKRRHFDFAEEIEAEEAEAGDAEAIEVLAGDAPKLRRIVDEVRGYLVHAARAIFGTRASISALVFALLPCGAMSLTLALGTALTVELGLTDTQIATLALVSTIIAGTCCVLGGLLSDLLGRRKMLVVYVLGMAAPTLVMAWLMYHEGHIMPFNPKDPNPPAIPAVLVTGLWVASLSFSVFQGMMTGTRPAMYMDVCDPAVAATQFTAYMAMINFVTWYSATWQGWALEHWGYPVVLTIDAFAGVLCVAALPWITPRPREDADADSEAEPEELPVEPSAVAGA
ncbi:MAG: MFS transporter [Phycisphaera sp.]|nr:MFS transporter [Phycisphaera sp.]